jgi:hypothetical protein
MCCTVNDDYAYDFYILVRGTNDYHGQTSIHANGYNTRAESPNEFLTLIIWSEVDGSGSILSALVFFFFIDTWWNICDM